MKPYPEIGDLDYYYFEDSFLLSVISGANFVEFTIETVLTERHPDFRLPLPNEQYCYEKYRLVFRNAASINWKEFHLRPICDIDGTVDFGAIDSFVKEGNDYILEGEWGEVLIRSDEPQMIKVSY